MSGGALQSFQTTLAVDRVLRDDVLNKAGNNYNDSTQTTKKACLISPTLTTPYFYSTTATRGLERLSSLLSVL
jgi:hypothetical protein